MHFEVLDKNGSFTHISFFLSAIRGAIQEKNPAATVSFIAQEDMSLSIQCSDARFNGTITRQGDYSYSICRVTPRGCSASFAIPSEFTDWAVEH